MRHFKLYKPYNYLTQFVRTETVRKNKKLLGELHDFPEGTMAIGRLDEKSEGLLLLTTDGKVSHEIRSSKFEKEYYIQVDGIITEEAIKKLRHGVEITVGKEKYLTKPCKAFLLKNNPELPFRHVRDERHGPMSWASVVISEGKNRQVRKMLASVDFPVLRLVRVRIGDILLENMEFGEVKEINI